MLDQPLAMLIPDVIGFRLSDRLHKETTASDLVLTEMLCRRDRVGRSSEFFGPVPKSCRSRTARRSRPCTARRRSWSVPPKARSGQKLSGQRVT